MKLEPEKSTVIKIINVGEKFNNQELLNHLADGFKVLSAVGVPRHKNDGYVQYILELVKIEFKEVK